MSDILNFFIRDYQGTKIIELNGNLDVNTVNTFVPLVEQIARKESVMINLENVGMVSSAGLNALIDVSFFAKENGRRVILLCINLWCSKLQYRKCSFHPATKSPLQAGDI